MRFSVLRSESLWFTTVWTISVIRMIPIIRPLVAIAIGCARLRFARSIPQPRHCATRG